MPRRHARSTARLKNYVPNTSKRYREPKFAPLKASSNSPIEPARPVSAEVSGGGRESNPPTAQRAIPPRRSEPGLNERRWGSGNLTALGLNAERDRREVPASAPPQRPDDPDRRPCQREPHDARPGLERQRDLAEDRK